MKKFKYLKDSEGLKTPCLKYHFNKISADVFIVATMSIFEKTKRKVKLSLQKHRFCRSNGNDTEKGREIESEKTGALRQACPALKFYRHFY